MICLLRNFETDRQTLWLKEVLSSFDPRKIVCKKNSMASIKGYEKFMPFKETLSDQPTPRDGHAYKDFQ